VTLFAIENRILIPLSVIGEHKDLLSKLLINKRILVGQGIVGWAAEMNEPVIVNDPYSHPRFLQEFDKKSGFVSRNILCVQVISDGKIKGVIQLLNKKGGGFNEVDSGFVKVVASIIGNAIKNSEHLKELKEGFRLKNCYETVLENIPSGFIGVATDKKVLFCNSSAGRILGLVDAETVGKAIDHAFSRLPALLEVLNSLMLTKSNVNRQEAELTKPNGEKFIMGYSSILLKDQTDKIIGHGLIFQDMAVPQ